MKGRELDFEIRFYEEILRRNPRHVDALIPLAEAYTRKGLYEKGLEMDKRLSKLRPKDAAVRYNLACSLALLHKKKEALAALGRAVQLGYTDWEHLARDPDLKGLRHLGAFKKLVGLLKSLAARS